MKPHEALEEIRKDLAVSFGEGLAARIIISARSNAQAPVIGLDRAKYVEMVRMVCKDERVVGMLGELGVKDRKAKWETLV